MSEKQPEEKIPSNHMRVSAKGEPHKYVSYGRYILLKSGFVELVIMGAGTSIGIAFQVAEQLRL